MSSGFNLILIARCAASCTAKTRIQGHCIHAYAQPHQLGKIERSMNTFSQAWRRRKLARALLLMSILCLAPNSEQKWLNRTSSKSLPPRLRSQACDSTRSWPFLKATIETCTPLRWISTMQLQVQTGLVWKLPHKAQLINDSHFLQNTRRTAVCAISLLNFGPMVRLTCMHTDLKCCIITAAHLIDVPPNMPVIPLELTASSFWNATHASPPDNIAKAARYCRMEMLLQDRLSCEDQNKASQLHVILCA